MIRNTLIEWFPSVGWAGTPPVPGGVAALNHRLMAGNLPGFIMLEALRHVTKTAQEENRELDLTLIDYGDLARPREQWRNVYEVTEEFYTHNGKYSGGSDRMQERTRSWSRSSSRWPRRRASRTLRS